MEESSGTARFDSVLAFTLRRQGEPPLALKKRCNIKGLPEKGRKNLLGETKWGGLICEVCVQEMGENSGVRGVLSSRFE